MPYDGLTAEELIRENMKLRKHIHALEHDLQAASIIAGANPIFAGKELQRSAANNKAIVDALPDLIFRLSHDCMYLDFKAPAFLKDIESTQSNFIGKYVYDILPADLAQKIAYYTQQAIQTGETQIFEHTLYTNKKRKHEEVRITKCGKEEVLLIVRDITIRKDAEEALLKSQAKNQAILNAIPDTMFRAAQDGTILEFGGKPIAQQLQFHHEMIGRNMRDILPPYIAGHISHHINQALRSGTTEIFEYQITGNPTAQYREMRLVSCGQDEILAIVRDITDRKIMEEELHHLSLHDPLTNLFNRAYFHKVVQRLSEEQATSIGIISCDVDGLKLVNDTFGHHEGDTLLTAAATVIMRALKSTDIAARIGGDEFVVILPNCTEKILETTCQQIVAGVAEYNAAKPQPILSISMGIALGQGSRSMLDLFKEADDRMYLEKLHRSRSTRSAIVQTLKQALEERDFITEGHGERMQDLVQTLAKMVGLAEHNLPALRLFAQFHDIGKVGIPDQVLFKPGPLTPEEVKIMRSHSEIGSRIAQSSPDLAHIADWILKHHEWWNGQGYPLGLAGEDIPLECRILAIADAYDAMTSDRPYRKAMSHTEAIIKLKKEARGQFDPYLIDMFVQLFE